MISVFLLSDMPVISFASLVVIAKHTDAIDNEREPVFEFVTAAADRLWNAPDDEMCDRPIAQRRFEPFHKFCVDHYHLPKVM